MVYPRYFTEGSRYAHYCSISSSISCLHSLTFWVYVPQLGVSSVPLSNGLWPTRQQYNNIMCRPQESFAVVSPWFSGMSVNRWNTERQTLNSLLEQALECTGFIQWHLHVHIRLLAGIHRCHMWHASPVSWTSFHWRGMQRGCWSWDPEMGNWSLFTTLLMAGNLVVPTDSDITTTFDDYGSHPDCLVHCLYHLHVGTATQSL